MHMKTHKPTPSQTRGKDRSKVSHVQGNACFEQTEKQMDRLDSLSHLPVYSVNMHNEIMPLTVGECATSEKLSLHLRLTT